MDSTVDLRGLPRLSYSDTIIGGRSQYYLYIERKETAVVTATETYMPIYYVHLWHTGKVTKEPRVMDRTLFYRYETVYEQLPEFIQELVWITLLNED